MLVTAWALNRKLSTYLKYYEMFMCVVFSIYFYFYFLVNSVLRLRVNFEEENAVLGCHARKQVGHLAFRHLSTSCQS